MLSQHLGDRGRGRCDRSKLSVVVIHSANSFEVLALGCGFLSTGVISSKERDKLHALLGGSLKQCV